MKRFVPFIELNLQLTTFGRRLFQHATEANLCAV